MYSAAAGQTALDRLPGEDPGQNSIYVRNLLPLMQQANLTLQDLASTLRRNVYQQAQRVPHQQWPAYYDGLIEKFCLVRCAEAATPPASATRRLDPPTAEAGLNLRPEDRLVVQEALTALDFDTRGVDGVFGANTRRAIISWQRNRGDEPTGYLTASQYGELLAEAEPKLAALESARRQPEPPSPVEPAVGIYHYKPGDEFQDCEQCPEMVVVPAGSFTMGSTEGERRWAVEQGAKQEWVDREKPQHRVDRAAVCGRQVRGDTRSVRGIRAGNGP